MKCNKHEITASVVSQSWWLMASFVASCNLMCRTLASARTSCGAAYHFYVIKSRIQEGGKVTEPWVEMYKVHAVLFCEQADVDFCHSESVQMTVFFPHPASRHINLPVCGKIKRPVALLHFASICCIWMCFSCGVQLAVHLHPDTVSADNLRPCYRPARTPAHLPLRGKQHGRMDESSTACCTKRWLYTNKLTNYQAIWWLQKSLLKVLYYAKWNWIECQQ